MNKHKLLAKARRSPHHLRFADLVTLILALGFQLDRIEGDHHFFVHPDHPCIMNIQPDNGKAKGYQVAQLLNALEKNGLMLEEE